jgi:CRP-like cAMP-binding protein
MRFLPEFDRMQAANGRSIALALEPACSVEELFRRSAASISLKPGEILFRQHDPCKGLYLLLSGSFLRMAERRESHLNLGPAGSGDLVELAAVLGDGRHTYVLAAETAATALLLSNEELGKAFQRYAWLRMQLLETLAREVSSAYNFCAMNRPVRGRKAVSGLKH